MPKKVLFIDDEDWSVSPYFEVLEDHDIEIDLAENGDRAVDFLRSKDYDLIVLDVMFAAGKTLTEVEPRKAGARLLSKIRNKEINNLKTKPEVPVVVLTAVTDHSLLDEIKKLDVRDILRKPVSFDEVIEKLTGLLAKA